MDSSITHGRNEDGQTRVTNRRSDALIGLLITAVTLFACLGGVEFAGYLWERNLAAGPFGWSLVASRRLDFQRYGALDQPYYLFEPGQNYTWRGIPVEISSRGLRTEEFILPKPANTYRILNVGDSIAFGWEVHLEETYGKQLERMLNGRGDGRDYEVINAAIPTWNLEAGRNFFLQEGLDYQPDLVILDVTIVNDIRGHGPEKIDEARTILHWMRENTYGWPFLAAQTRFLLSRQSGPEAIAVLNPPTRASAYFPLDRESEVWDRMWRPIQEMHEAAQEQGIPFIIVAFPTAFQLSSLAHPDLPQQILAERSAAAGIPFIDLLPVYAQACRQAGDDACEGYQNLLFADVWMHPNLLGHQMTAQEIEVILESHLPGR